MFDYFNVGLPTIPCFLSFLLAFSHAFSFIIKFGHDDHAYLVHISIPIYKYSFPQTWASHHHMS